MALLNLAVNARDAMPDGGTIMISARAARLVGAADAIGLPPGDYVCLSVADTGDGMDETTLARATEPFFTTKGVGKGTGLGLSMVHGLAEQSGGRLRPAKPAGRRHDRRDLAAGRRAGRRWPQPSAAPTRAATSRRRRPLTILAVDDDAWC